MKKVLFFTSTRADYGILSRLIMQFKSDSSYQTEILATGSHLSDKHGQTYKEIEADGISIKFKEDIQLNADDELSVAKSAGLAVQKYANVLQQYKPDLCFVLGDRFEALSFAFACQMMRSPLAHLHGGEITEGAIDDSFRHCITKIAALHFTSAEVHKNRVSQLGEDPKLVFNVGALGVDNIVHLKKMSKDELEKNLNLKFKKNIFLTTFHPETISKFSALEQVKLFLKGLADFLKAESDSLFIFTMPNADPGNDIIFKEIQSFIQQNPTNAVGFDSLGHHRYLSLMSLATGVIGNSSSGLIEAPALQVPTLNVGDRQKGRLSGNSVIDVALSAEDIVTGLNKILVMKQSKAVCESPYGKGDTAVAIKKIVDTNFLQPIPVRKKFYDQKC